MQEAIQQTELNTGAREDAESGGSDVNVNQTERWISGLAGGALAIYGLTRRTWGGAVLALVGGTLIHRGSTGHCYMYDALGVSTAGTETGNPLVSVPAGHGIKVEKSVTVNRPPEEVYRFWRDFQNLPRFMNHLESVTDLGNGRSHWVAKAPAGKTVEWDAEVYNEKENELIAWRSLEGADVDNAGSVRFEPAPEGRGTTVRVTLKYDPPAGKIGSLIAKLWGEEPSQQIEEDLRRFKQVMEAGEIPTTEGQPSGRSASAGK
ncbi:MAG TPA: SRPBCC family protein [Pyrinomonadaceae bacterium]|nr:SRPBCC family protein [Pyrinomonadaceae bacterium]